jgi:putative cell wall-binding protein
MKKIKLLVTSIIISISFSLPTSVFASNDVGTNSNKPFIIRLAGTDRYETCNKIVNEGWSQSDCAILVNSDMFADAITSAPLAKKYNAPILLTEGNTLTASTKNQLIDLKVKTVYIIGGSGVISNDILNNLHSIGITTKRIAGNDRYETSIAVAKELNGNDGTKGMFIVSGDTFEDALSAAPIASKLQYPIILVAKDSVPNAVKNYATSNQGKDLFLVGGPDVLNSNISKELTPTKVYNQADKYSRNLALINDFKENLNLNNILIASDSTFADALSGSALAGKSANPIILLGNSNVETTSNFISKNSVKTIDVLGGRGVLSDNTVNSIIGNTAVSNSSLDSIPDNTDLTETQMNDLLSQLQGDWYKQIYLKDKNVVVPYNDKVLHFNEKTSEKFQFITAYKNDAQSETIKKIKKISGNQYLFYGIDGTGEYDTLFSIDNDKNLITLISCIMPGSYPSNGNSTFSYNQSFIRTDLSKSINQAVYIGKFKDSANNTYEFKDDLTAVWPNKSFKYKIEQLDEIGNSYLLMEYDSNGNVTNRYISEDTGNTRVFYSAVPNTEKQTDADPSYKEGTKAMVLTKTN